MSAQTVDASGDTAMPAASTTSVEDAPEVAAESAAVVEPASEATEKVSDKEATVVAPADSANDLPQRVAPPPGPPPAHLLAAREACAGNTPDPCSACGCVQTAAWRTDRVDKSRLCNKCYYKRYPVKVAASGEVNGDAKADKTEATEKKEDVSDRKQKKDKKDKKKDEKKEKTAKEEPADNESSKRKRVDSETDFAAGADNDDANDGKKKKKKEKKEKRGSTDEIFEQLDVDLEMFPKVVRVETSSRANLDGRYERMPEPSAGRPCYTKQAVQANPNSKAYYLYWRGDMWAISVKLGASQKHALAMVKSVGEQQLPTEPYPHVWQVQDKSDSKEEKADKIFVKVLAMRVIDGDIAETERGSVNKNQKTPKVSKTLSPAPDAVDAVASDADASTKTVDAGDAAVVKPQDTAAKVESNVAADGKAVEEAANEDAPNAEEDQSEEDEPSEAAPSCDSSVNSSDSSSDSDSEPAAKPEATQQRAPVPEAAAPKQSEVFEKRCRAELAKTRAERGLQACKMQLTKIGDSMRKRTPEDLGKSGLTFNSLSKMLAELEQDFLGPQHRKVDSAKTALKKSSGRAPRERRLKWGAQVAKDLQIVSHRSDGEKLWYQNPGQIVECDDCLRPVPQTAGCLAGSPGLSQFAQQSFYCLACNAKHYGETLGQQQWGMNNGNA